MVNKGFNFFSYKSILFSLKKSSIKFVASYPPTCDLERECLRINPSYIGTIFELLFPNSTDTPEVLPDINKLHMAEFIKLTLRTLSYSNNISISFILNSSENITESTIINSNKFVSILKRSSKTYFKKFSISVIFSVKDRFSMRG